MPAISTRQPRLRPAPIDGREPLITRALSRLNQRLREPGAFLGKSGLLQDYACLAIGGEAREVFLVFLLDVQLRLIACERMFTGTLTQTEVHPREIARAALLHNAAAVALAHNHPSGDTTPSDNDMRTTRSVAAALALIDVKLVDHLVVGGTHAHCMRADKNWPA